MKPLLSRIALCLLVLTFAAESHAQDSAGLRRQLAGVYNVWRNAMVTKNLAQWQANTSRRRQVVVKNRIYSERASFPAALFALPVAPPRGGVHNSRNHRRLRTSVTRIKERQP